MSLSRQNQAPDELTDAAGTRHSVATSPPRIVSLVPSITELVCDLGLDGALVGRTGFCIHPRAIVRRIPKVGGTKDVSISRIRELAPTHVIVNIDENEKPAVEEIARFVPHIIVTHPLAPLDNLALYRLLGGIFDRADRAAQLCAEFGRVHGNALEECARLPRQDVLYLIWKKPWMTVSRDTYISRTLALVHWNTVPTDARVRYPELELDAAVLGSVHHVLLSSEPYRFRERDVVAVRKLLPANAHCKVSLIDGETTSWYGSRAIAGLASLARLRRELG